MNWPLAAFFSCDDSEDGSSDLNEPQIPFTKPKIPPSVVQSPLITLLQHFENPGVCLPPSARVGDPKLKQRENQPSYWQFWKYGAFAAMKATEILSAVLSHSIRGPPKKSWGIEMTLLSCIMRDAGRHSHLTDIATIRLLMSIGGLVPLPSDALVTPVTFRVRKRQLRGILENFDAAEDGTRELSGEWVVGKRTWHRLQHEWRSSKRRQSRSQSPMKDNDPSPPPPQPKRKERVILYLHGGAYYMFSPATHRLITIPLSKSLDARLFALDYRLAPETRFPGPLHDCVSAYFRMIDDLHISPENIVVAGDSAGGGLAVALLMYLRDNGYPLPGGAILMSPWVDLTMSCDSWESNAPFDIVPMPLPGDHLNPIACYLGEHMEKYLTHPYASPLFGDLKGLPPLLIQAGDSEVLRDEITLFAHKATLAGVTVRHELYEDAVHVFQSMPFLDVARRAFTSAREFVRDGLVPVYPETTNGLPGKAERELQQEINSDSARVVQGDGTDCTTGRDEMGSTIETSSVSEASSTPDAIPTPDEEPSWAQPWPSPSIRTDLQQLESIVTCIPVGTEKPTSHRRNSTTTRPLDSPRVSPPNRHRAPSYSHQVFTKTSSKDTSSRGYRFSTITMSSSTAPIPQPSIRRSHSSHPDITTLCQQWAFNGPANQTLTYKPESVVKHKHSLAFSPNGPSAASNLVAPGVTSASTTRRCYII